MISGSNLERLMTVMMFTGNITCFSMTKLLMVWRALILALQDWSMPRLEPGSHLGGAHV